MSSIHLENRRTPLTEKNIRPTDCENGVENAICASNFKCRANYNSPKMLRPCAELKLHNQDEKENVKISWSDKPTNRIVLLQKAGPSTQATATHDIRRIVKRKFLPIQNPYSNGISRKVYGIPVIECKNSKLEHETLLGRPEWMNITINNEILARNAIAAAASKLESNKESLLGNARSIRKTPSYLQGSRFNGDVSYSDIIPLYKDITNEDEGGYLFEKKEQTNIVQDVLDDIRTVDYAEIKRIYEMTPDEMYDHLQELSDKAYRLLYEEKKVRL